MTRPSRFARGRGFSLIEVLTAMVVLSIGMLGIAAMYTTSLKTGRSAQLRTKGVVFAADMADRIRANPGGAVNYVTAANGAGTSKGCTDRSTAGSVAAAVACTTDQMAVDDIYRWKQLLTNPQSGLPKATATIDYDNTTTPPTYTVTVNWTDQDEALSYTLSLQI